MMSYSNLKTSLVESSFETSMSACSQRRTSFRGLEGRGWSPVLPTIALCRIAGLRRSLVGVFTSFTPKSRRDPEKVTAGEGGPLSARLVV
jgi:hypothetical protein